MQVHIILILLLVLIVLAALFQRPNIGTEYFETGFKPEGGTGRWGESPPCTDKAIGFQEDKYNPGRYWGWLEDKQQSCAFYNFSNDLLPDYYAKDGNNGTVNCLEYCKGNWKGKSIDGCIGGWDSASGQRIDCNKVQGPGANVQCWCQKGEGVPNAKMQLDGKEINVCNNPSLATTKDDQGRMWGYENGASCMVR